MIFRAVFDEESLLEKVKLIRDRRKFYEDIHEQARKYARAQRDPDDYYNKINDPGRLFTPDRLRYGITLAQKIVALRFCLALDDAVDTEYWIETGIEGLSNFPHNM